MTPHAERFGEAQSQRRRSNSAMGIKKTEVKRLNPYKMQGRTFHFTSFRWTRIHTDLNVCLPQAGIYTDNRLRFYPYLSVFIRVDPCSVSGANEKSAA